MPFGQVTRRRAKALLREVGDVVVAMVFLVFAIPVFIVVIIYDALKKGRRP
jgi:hypothetical protein